MHESMKWWYCLQCQAALQLQQQDPTMKTAIFLQFLVPTFNIAQYPFSLYFLKVIPLCNYGDRYLSIMKTFITSFFHRKSIMNQQDTIKEKDKTIRNKYILNTLRTGDANLRFYITTA